MSVLSIYKSIQDIITCCKEYFLPPVFGLKTYTRMRRIARTFVMFSCSRRGKLNWIQLLRRFTPQKNKSLCLKQCRQKRICVCKNSCHEMTLIAGIIRMVTMQWRKRKTYVSAAIQAISMKEINKLFQILEKKIETK